MGLMTQDRFEKYMVLNRQRDLLAHRLVGMVKALIQIGCLDRADINTTTRQALTDLLIEFDDIGMQAEQEWEKAK